MGNHKTWQYVALSVLVIAALTVVTLAFLRSPIGDLIHETYRAG